MLKPSKSLLSGDKAISLEGDVLTWDGQEPVYVHLRSNHQPINEPQEGQVTERNPPATSFCWDQDYSRLEISPLFKQLVEQFDTSNPIRDPAKTLKFTFKGYYHHICPNRACPLVNVYLPAIDCGRYHPQRSFKHVSRCASKVLDQIEFLENKVKAQDPPIKAGYLICLDLTCPKDVSIRVRDPHTIKHLRLAVNRFIEYLRLLLSHGKRRFSRLGGFYSIHVWATNDPLKPHLHVHLQLFNVAFNGKKRQFYRFKPMLSHFHVKEAWKRALKSVGFWHDPNERSLPDCYVRYVSLKIRGRVIHRLRYIFRKPIVDLNSNLKPDDLQGEIDPGWLRYLLDYTPRRVKIGFMTNLKRLGYLCPKSFSERCPFCGSSLTNLGFKRGSLPNFPHFIRDRGAGWSQVDPPGGSFWKPLCDSSI